jgi:hypothetical protein
MFRIALTRALNVSLTRAQTGIALTRALNVSLTVSDSACRRRRRRRRRTRRAASSSSRFAAQIRIVRARRGRKPALLAAGARVDRARKRRVSPPRRAIPPNAQPPRTPESSSSPTSSSFYLHLTPAPPRAIMGRPKSQHASRRGRGA